MFLYVNSKNKIDFGYVAHTNTLDYFYKNLKIIGEEYKKSFMDAYKETERGMIDIQILGRYITIIQLAANEENPQMIFHDVDNNEEKALGVSTSLMFSADDGTMNENYMKHFMNKFYELQPHYKENYPLVDLIFNEAEIN